MAVSSSVFGRSAPEDIFQPTKPLEVAKGPEARFDCEALIDGAPDRFGVAGGPESFAESPDLCGFK
jgi:hypothetical protein